VRSRKYHGAREGIAVAIIMIMENKLIDSPKNKTN
jgi:hypothetical protein